MPEAHRASRKHLVEDVMTTQAKPFNLDHAIGEMVGTFTDPIIVAGAWGADIPTWVKERITVERLIAVKQDRGKGTDAEAMAYLFSASLEAPMDSDWAEIFLYVATKEMRIHGTDMPDDIKVDSLSEYRQGELNRLKTWIYERRVKARAERAKAERQAAKLESQQAEETEPHQLAFQF